MAERSGPNLLNLESPALEVLAVVEDDDPGRLEEPQRKERAMCGRSFARYERGFGMRHRGRHSHWHGYREGEFFGLDVAKMSPRGRVVAAFAVLLPVALSGMILAFTPVWWIFTTYFWISFPAFGLLVRGVAGLAGDARPVRVTSEDGERELLIALRRHGGLTPAGVASETSLSVTEADRRLRELAEGGHLDVRVSGGGIFYALWEAGPESPPEATIAVEGAKPAQTGSAGLADNEAGYEGMS